MSEIEITVRGSHTAFAPPERATVHLVAALEAGDAVSVYSSIVDVAADLRQSIEALHRPESGPVTWWSSDQVQTWASRPWHKDGKRLPLVFHARVSFEVKFSDFAAMSRWVNGAAELPGAAVNGIEWALTAAHRERLTNTVRSEAVRDAVAKAQTYSNAVGSGTVRMVAMADAGMLGSGVEPVAAGQPMFSRMAAPGGGGGDLEFAAHDVSITAEIDARFITV